MVDFKSLDAMLAEYPKLSLVLLSGVVSWKVARNLLGITTSDMGKLYIRLLEAKAVRGVSSSNFRAVPEVLDYLKSKEVHKNDDQ